MQHKCDEVPTHRAVLGRYFTCKCDMGFDLRVASKSNMRKFFSALIFFYAGLASLTASAELIVYEPFAYPVGDALDGIDGAAVDGGGKTAANGNQWYPAGYNTQSTFNALVGTEVIDLNLGVAGLQEPAGNAVWYGGNGYTARLGIGSIDSGTLYASFAFRITDITGLPSTGGVVAAFNNTPGPQSGSPSVYDAMLRVRPTPETTDNPANYNIGVRKNPSTTTVWDTGVYTASENGPVQFAVTSYTFNSGSTSDDTVSLYLNPAPSTFGGTTPATGTILSTSTGNDIASGQIATLMLRQGTQGGAPAGIVFDELRVGTTWADVTPAGTSIGGAPPGPMNGGPVATTSLDDFQPFSYTDPEGVVMPYRVFVPPDYDPQRKYPLIVQLHGAGETGTDNIGPASHVVSQRLAARAKDPEYESILLVPQTHSGFGNYWSPEALSAVLDIMASLEGQYNIDVNREYVMGISMGANGVMDFITQYPDKFAAAVPVATGGTSGNLANVKDMPIWAFHSTADEVVPTSQTQQIIEALRMLGGDPRYTEYPFGTHGNSFNDAYSEPQLFDWLFDQALPAASDFNHDGMVDTADYVAWRKNGGTPDEYERWRRNYGRTTSSGNGVEGFFSADGVSAQVPEPATGAILLLGAMLLTFFRRPWRC